MRPFHEDSQPLCRSSSNEASRSVALHLWWILLQRQGDQQPISDLDRDLDLAAQLNHEAEVNEDCIHIFEGMAASDFLDFIAFLRRLECGEMADVIEEGRRLHHAHRIPREVLDDPDPLAVDLDPPVWTQTDMLRYQRICRQTVASLKCIRHEIAAYLERHPQIVDLYQSAMLAYPYPTRQTS